MSDLEIEIAPDGKLLDLLSGALLEDRPEERVRQWFLRVLHFEYGYAKNVMAREVTIMAGSSPALDIDGQPVRADIVVYFSATACRKRDQSQIKFVVECKRPDVDSGFNQLVSYIFNTSAGGGVWTNGSHGEDDFQAFRRHFQPRNTLEAAPDLPRSGEEWDTIGHLRREQLDRPRDVKRLLRICHNRLHGRGIDTDDEDLTMDMVRLILAKTQDEIASGPLQFYCTDDEYRSADGRAAVAARVKPLFRKFADENPGVFSDHEEIGVSDSAITEVVAVLQPYSILTRLEDADDWDIMGGAYEEYTATHLKRTRGQFFTNRRLIDLMVRIADPDESTKALDPAGGSGGFMTAVLRFVRHKIIANTRDGSTAREHQLANLRQRLFMVEISPRLVKIAKTAMLLNGDGHSGMTRGDSLGPYAELDDWIKSRAGQGAPTLILTNPPFAGQGEGQVTEPEVLSQYRVARRWATDAHGNFTEIPDSLVEGCPPEMLFFERCLDWLAPGGRMAIVMPKSFLDTLTYRPARELLFAQARLLAVINCHKNTFQPHTGVRTCVVILQKRRDGEPPEAAYPIFMAISRKVGQDSEGVPIYQLGNDGIPTDIVDHDLDDIYEAYESFMAGSLEPSEYRYQINRSEIEDSLNVNPQRYLPHLNDTLRAVQEMDGRDGWTVTSISQIEQGIRIFKGPRLRTENLLVEGPDDGKKVEAYYPPSAILQDRRDSLKWLDLSKATEKQLKAYEQVRVRTGDILVTRSGSIGRIAYITSRLDKAIVSDDAIRIRIANEDLRAYVYAYIQSRLAQDQLHRNEYGSVQQHLEWQHVADVLIPIPEDWTTVRAIIEGAKAFFASKEKGEASIEAMAEGIATILQQEATDVAAGEYAPESPD